MCGYDAAAATPTPTPTPNPTPSPNPPSRYDAVGGQLLQGSYVLEAGEI